MPSQPGAMNMPKSGENMRRSCGVVGAKWMSVAKSRATRAEMFCRGISIMLLVSTGTGCESSKSPRGNQALRQTRVPANRRTIPLP